MGISVCAIAKNKQKSVVDTPFRFKKICWEFWGKCTYLLRSSSVSCSQYFRKVYVSVPLNILGLLQKFKVRYFRCNSASGYDVDHFCALGGWSNQGYVGPNLCPVCSYYYDPYPIRQLSLLFMKTFWAKILYWVWYTTSQMGCLNKLFSKSRGTYRFEELG